MGGHSLYSMLTLDLRHTEVTAVCGRLKKRRGLHAILRASYLNQKYTFDITEWSQVFSYRIWKSLCKNSKRFFFKLSIPLQYLLGGALHSSNQCELSLCNVLSGTVTMLEKYNISGFHLPFIYASKVLRIWVCKICTRPIWQWLSRSWMKK